LPGWGKNNEDFLNEAIPKTGLTGMGGMDRIWKGLDLILRVL
jgi:hypothetical protein